jgi:polynucleotide 5'-hydroxyl-kinase GRC3/NOL9
MKSLRGPQPGGPIKPLPGHPAPPVMGLRMSAKSVHDSAWLHVPADWTHAIEMLLSTGVRRAVVLGPADVGKSSFCRSLLFEAARSGRSVALIDADVGQKTVGPPAAVTLSDATSYAQGELPLAGLAFAGTTSPAHAISPIVAGTRRLVMEARADLAIVNTSGLLAGPGRRLKSGKLAAVAPDLLVALGRDPGLEAILKEFRAVPTVRLSPSPCARKRTAAERRRARAEAFRRYFAGSAVWRLNVRSLGDRTQAYAAEGLLVGIADRCGRDIALGIVRRYRWDRNELELFAPDIRRRAARVIPGLLYLDDNFRELRLHLSHPFAGRAGT